MKESKVMAEVKKELLIAQGKMTPRERILATRTGGVTETKTTMSAQAAGEILKGMADNL